MDDLPTLSAWANRDRQYKLKVEIVQKFIDGATWIQLSKEYGIVEHRLRRMVSEFSMPDDVLAVARRKYAARQLRKYKLKSLK